MITPKMRSELWQLLKVWHEAPAGDAAATAAAAVEAYIEKMTAGAVPDFEAVRDKRMAELTPAQKQDAHELWLRENIGWMPEYHREHYTFLLRRLDVALQRYAELADVFASYRHHSQRADERLRIANLRLSSLQRQHDAMLHAMADAKSQSAQIRVVLDSARAISCPVCKGRGEVETGIGMMTCDRCGGSKLVVAESPPPPPEARG